MTGRRLAAFVAGGFLALPACSGNEPGTVTMLPGQRFDPATITIAPGDTVTWVDEADDAHTVTAYEDSLPAGAEYFASGGAESEKRARNELSEGLITSGQTYEVTFEQPGTYEYFCIPHESDGMKGTVVVK